MKQLNLDLCRIYGIFQDVKPTRTLVWKGQAKDMSKIVPCSPEIVSILHRKGGNEKAAD